MAVIEFDHVTKTYQLGARGSLRETLMNALPGLVRKKSDGRKSLNALDDVSFKVVEGEVLGFIGANGAGKTTALKILSRVTYPTKGSVSVDGRISALIELGAGFHPDLSGAENIYLNASILGLKRAEIDAKFDEIVAFSGLEEFLDTPVKRYSSGMYARLAFSVAAHVDPDVLLVDEVLSVGDAIFQEKCLNRMKEIRDKGKAMVFVSHNMIAVQNICSRVIWLDHGKVRAVGEPEEVISRYLHNQYFGQQNILDLEEGEELFRYDEGSVVVEAIKILDEAGEPFQTIRGGGSVKVEVHYSAKRQLNSPNIQIYLTDKQHHRLMGSDLLSSNYKGRRTISKGEGVVSCTFDAVPIRPNIYHFNVDILEENRLIYRQKDIGPVIVRPDQTALKFEDYNLFDMRCHWELDGCSENMADEGIE
jgi:ABC-type polysaccharide/polyol phosphate transport system ATPase subunit